MATIAVGNLPPPHAIAIADESVVRRSTIGRLPFWARPDAALSPRRFELTWGGPAVGALADAIQRHYDEHPHDVIAITLPTTGEVVRVQFAAPPSIQWDSAAYVQSVTVAAEEALAFD